MAQTLRVATHRFNHPDPVGEADFTAQRLSGRATKIPNNSTNLGAFFDLSMDLFGYRCLLGQAHADIRQALRIVAELGVALFQRGSYTPDELVTLTLEGNSVEMAGGVSHYNSAPRWAYAVGAALTLRDEAALESLSHFNVLDFEGTYDAYHKIFAEALVAFLTGKTAEVAGHLDRAADAASKGTVVREIALRVGVPTIVVARDVLLGDATSFDVHVAEGLTWYQTVHARPPHNHQAAYFMPLVYLGLCSLAHDRGMPCQVQSDYIPTWLLDGSLGGA